MPGGYHRVCCCYEAGCAGGPATVPSYNIVKYKNLNAGYSPSLFLERYPYIHGLQTTVVNNKYINQLYRLKDNKWETITHDNFNVGGSFISYNLDLDEYVIFQNIGYESLGYDYQNLLAKINSSNIYEEIYITPVGYHDAYSDDYTSYEQTINAMAYDSINHKYYFMEYSKSVQDVNVILKIWQFTRSTETWELIRRQNVVENSSNPYWPFASGIYDSINSRYIIAFKTEFPVSGYHKITLYDGSNWSVIAVYNLPDEYDTYYPILLYNPDDEKVYIILYVYKSPTLYYRVLQLDNNTLIEYDIGYPPAGFAHITDITYDTDRHVAVMILARNGICEYDFVSKTFSNVYTLVEPIRALRIIYNPDIQKCLIYGGSKNPNQAIYNNQIYIWNGVNIENIYDTNMGNLCGKLFYDTEYDDIVLFGGMYSYTNFTNASVQPFANAWYLDNLEWKHITTRPIFNHRSRTPYFSYNTIVIYMPNIQKFLIFLSLSQCNTYLYDPVTDTFEQLLLDLQPPARMISNDYSAVPVKMCYDSSTQKVFLLIHYTTNYELRLDLWMFDPLIKKWYFIKQGILGENYDFRTSYLLYAFGYMHTINKLLISCQIRWRSIYTNKFDMLFSYDTIKNEIAPIPVSCGQEYDGVTALFYQDYTIFKSMSITYKLDNFEDYLLLCMKANIVGITLCPGCFQHNYIYFELLIDNSHEIIYLKHRGHEDVNEWISLKPVYVFKQTNYSSNNCTGEITKEEILNFYLRFELLSIGYAKLTIAAAGAVDSIFYSTFQIPPNENYFIKTAQNTNVGPCPLRLGYGGNITIEGIR